MTVTFSKDIIPIFSPFRDEMMWRLDLTNYDHVSANAETILNRINGHNGPMPPPPFDPLTDAQVQLFEQWIAGGCQP
jgi:hypothetical protein